MATPPSSNAPGPTGTLAYASRPRRGSVELDQTLQTVADATQPDPLAVVALDGSARSTVLPRVEHVEGTRRIVTAGRPRYEDLARLGSGGQAHVVLARDHDIDRKVAVKRLRPDVADEGAMLRFAEEVRVVGQLEHPNVVPIHDVGVDHNGHYFYVMKHVEGETLEQVIARLRAGDPEYLARYTSAYRAQICYEVLRGVEHAHSLGILHRDLKPSNIMVGRLGEVVVMDWGLAKSNGSLGALEPRDAPGAGPAVAAGGRDRLFETQSGALLGTPAYMSPEQAAGHFDALDARSDIYSLAVVFYELFCLRHPRRAAGSLAAVLVAVASEPIALSQLVGDFVASGAPAVLAHFVRHGIEHDPAARYPSVTAMRERLARVRDGKAPIECQISLVKRALDGVSHGVDRHPIVTTAILVIVALGVLGCLGAAVWLLVR